MEDVIRIAAFMSLGPLAEELVKFGEAIPLLARIGLVLALFPVATFGALVLFGKVATKRLERERRGSYRSRGTYYGRGSFSKIR